MVPVELDRDAVFGVRAVEGDLPCPEPGVPAAGGPVAVVEALASPTVPRPLVVRLPGGDRQDHAERGGPPVVADHERGAGAPAVRRGEDGLVEAGGPVVGDADRPGHRPAAGDRPGRRVGRRHRLRHAVELGAGQHRAGARAVVPAEPVDGDPVPAGRVDRDVEVDRLAGGDAGGRGVPLDLAVPVVHCRVAVLRPPGRAGGAVLHLDRGRLLPDHRLGVAAPEGRLGVAAPEDGLAAAERHGGDPAGEETECPAPAETDHRAAPGTCERGPAGTGGG